MPSTLLAYIYPSFPDLPQTTVSLIVTLPALASVVMSFLMGLILTKVSKKTVLVGGVALQLLSAIIIVCSGGTVFSMALGGAILSGMVYALIYTASSSAITEYEDPDHASKHLGINYAVMYGGIMILIFVSGILAQDGYWVRAYYAYLILVPILIYCLIALPPMKAGATAETTHTTDLPRKEGGSVVTLALIFIVYFAFWIGSYALTLNISSYIITEFQLGTSVEAGTAGTLASLGAFLGGFIASAVVTRLKTYTTAACCIVHALIFIILIYVPNFGVVCAVEFLS
ncbi:MAG: MFS transporter [Clostridiales bacterium]|nr:MFS transporter [Clostridiales bacterium]